MAASPMWKIYRNKKDYEGSVKDIALAIIAVEWLGVGSMIKIGHKDIVFEYDGKPITSYDEIISSIEAKL